MTEACVILPNSVIDQIEPILSPGDEITAIDQIHGQLPQLHRPRRSGIRRLFAKSLPLHRGYIDYLLVGFTYVVVDNSFHILSFREFSRSQAARLSFDCRLSRPLEIEN